jgi:hypothetical protein
MKTLVVGWFSWADCNATFGDIQAMEVVTKWLSDEGFDYDVAQGGNYEVEEWTWERYLECNADLRGLSREEAFNHYQNFGITEGRPPYHRYSLFPWIGEYDPVNYDSFIFVCGPWWDDYRCQHLMEEFSSCFRIGIDVSVQGDSHGFSLLLARDFQNTSNPDIVFEAKSDVVPVVGLALAHPQSEYGDRQRHSQVEEVVSAYLKSEGSAVIRLDTKTQDNNAGISTVSQLEALIRRCDLVISSRLHGMVYSLKNDIPVLAIDCVAGGAKVTAQAKALGWSAIINGDGITVDRIRDGVKQALNHKSHINNVKITASGAIAKIRSTMIEELKNYRSNCLPE